jgi:hypothetical protein
LEIGLNFNCLNNGIISGSSNPPVETSSKVCSLGRSNSQRPCPQVTYLQRLKSPSQLNVLIHAYDGIPSIISDDSS